MQKRTDFADFCRFAEIMASFSLDRTSKSESNTNPALQMDRLSADGASAGRQLLIPWAQPWDADVLPRGAHRKAVMTWKKMACEHKNGRNLVCFKKTRLTE